MSGEELKAAAWLYTKPGRCRYFTGEFMDRTAEGWSATALFAHPLPEQPQEGEAQPPQPNEEFCPVRFGENVASMMIQHNLTCRGAAAETGLSSATINRVARGGMPDVPTYLRLMNWLRRGGR